MLNSLSKVSVRIGNPGWREMKTVLQWKSVFSREGKGSVFDTDGLSGMWRTGAPRAILVALANRTTYCGSLLGWSGSYDSAGYTGLSVCWHG